MPKKIIIGKLFAYGFYSPDLHRAKPSATYAFSELRPSPTVGWLGISRTVNILWRGAAMEIVQHSAYRDELETAKAEARQKADIASVQRMVAQQHPDAGFRGLFTTTNILIVDRIADLQVVGPPVELDNFQDGPIKRIDPLRDSLARKRLLRLVSGGDRFDKSGLHSLS